MTILKTLNTLISDNALTLGDKSTEIFDYFMKDAFQVYYREKKEPAKVETLRTVLNCVEWYYRVKMIPVEGDVNGCYEVASKQTFMPGMIEEVVTFLTDYFDNVREAAQLLILFICRHFIQHNHALSG